MENVVSLKWLWYKPYLDDGHDGLNDASFIDDDLDTFHNHLNEIDCVHTTNSGPADSHTRPTTPRHIDPRNGQPTSRYLIDATFDANPKLCSALNAHISRLTGWQHNVGIRALQTNHKQPVTTALTSTSQHEIDQDATTQQVFDDTASQRAAEVAEFSVFAREHFAATVQLRCAAMPFFSEQIANEWRQRVDAALVHYAGRSYSIQTAIPLEHPEELAANRSRMELGQLFQCGGRLPVYQSRKPRSYCPVGGRVLPSRSTLICPMRMHLDLPGLLCTEKADAYLSVRVLRQLIDYPANSATSWAVPFEIAETTTDERRFCVFDELVPDPVMLIGQRNQLALRRQLLGSTLSPAQKQDPATDEVQTVDSAIGSNSSRVQWYKPWAFETYVAEHGQRNVQHDGYNSSFIQTVTLFDAADPQQMLRLLVHTEVDGIEMGGINRSPVAVNISAKPEHQTEFGSEQMGQGELIDEWCRQVFYPDSVTDRYRMDAESGTILSVRRMSRIDIETDMLRLYALTPGMLLTRLYNTLRLIVGFPCQQYLMRHSCQSDRTARVYARSTDGNPNAVTVAQVLSAEAKLIPVDNLTWLPIDASLLTGIHFQANVMPCMFPHKHNQPDVKPNRGKSLQLKHTARNPLIARTQSTTVGSVVHEGAKVNQAVKRKRKHWHNTRSGKT